MNEEIDAHKNSKILTSGLRLTISRSQTIDRLPRLRIDAVEWDSVVTRAAQIGRGGSMQLLGIRHKVRFAPNSREVPRPSTLDMVCLSSIREGSQKNMVY